MKQEAKVIRAAEQNMEFERRLAAKRAKKETTEDAMADKRRKINEEKEGKKRKVEDENGEEEADETRLMKRLREDEDEGMGGADDHGARGQGGDEGEDEGRGKRVRIGGVLVADAVKEIEKWIAGMRIDWEK